MTQLLLTLRAVNSAPDSENRMHDDAVARSYGFAAGGLVPGVDVFEYLARPVPEWLAPGKGGELRLRKPFFDGETVEIASAAGSQGLTLCAGGDRATLELTLPGDWPAADLLAPIDARALPSERPQASVEALALQTTLGSITGHVMAHPDPDSHKAREILELANQILMRNVVLKPWIHTGSRMLWQNAFARSTERIDVRAKVLAEFERKRHRLVTLAVHYTETQTGEPVALVEHTAIWKYAKP